MGYRIIETVEDPTVDEVLCSFEDQKTDEEGEKVGLPSEARIVRKGAGVVLEIFRKAGESGSVGWEPQTDWFAAAVIAMRTGARGPVPDED